MNKLIISVVLFVVLPVQALADRLVSYHQADRMAYVLYTKAEAEKLGKGTIIKIKTDEGLLLKGKLLNKGKWFHKVMAKVQVMTIEKL